MSRRGTAGPRLQSQADVFGCVYRDVDYGTGTYSEVITHPLARFGSVEEIEANYRWPSPDWYDYRGIPDQVAGWEHYPIQGGGSEPFLIYKNLRGQEQAMIDLVEHPEIVHYCLDKLFDLAYTDTRTGAGDDPGEGDVLLRGGRHGRAEQPDVLEEAYPHVPAAAHEAHDRPGASGRRLRVPPQRRQLPGDPPRTDRVRASTC